MWKAMCVCVQEGRGCGRREGEEPVWELLAAEVVARVETHINRDSDA